MAKYEVKLTFTEPMLGSSPQDPEVYTQFIESRKRQDAEERGEEVETLPAEKIEPMGSSVYHRDQKGLFIFDYKLRGFLKEAAASVTGKTKLSAYRSKIDKWVFVFPRRVYLHNGKGILQKPDGSEQRPIRAMTAQGPRVTVKRSEKVNEGTTCAAEIHILPLGEKEITEEVIREWLDYGKYSGLGEWRTGSYGRFEYELKKL
jgi:hypothetical protein